MQVEKILNELNKLVDNKEIPGYVLGIIDHDNDYKYCYGYRKIINGDEETTLDTLYDLASLSKCISTVTCILKLQEEGLLNIDDKVSKYLDIYEKDITIKQCLTHTTGFESDLDGYKTMNDEQFLFALKNVKSLPEYIGLVHYSDVNFIYLGFIVQKLKGSLDKYATDVIFKPLHMDHTCYNPKNKEICAATELSLTRGLIQGEVHDGKAFRLNGVSGSAGLFSNINDLLIFIKSLMDGKLLNEDSMNLIKNPIVETKTGNRSAGWIISDETNSSMGNKYSKHTIFHTGFTGGSIFLDFDKQIGCIILCNRIHPSRNNDSIINLRGKIHNLLEECEMD